MIEDAKQDLSRQLVKQEDIRLIKWEETTITTRGNTVDEKNDEQNESRL